MGLTKTLANISLLCVPFVVFRTNPPGESTAPRELGACEEEGRDGRPGPYGLGHVAGELVGARADLCQISRTQWVNVEGVNVPH